MNYAAAASDMADEIYNVLHTVIKTIYPKYYPKEVVDWYLNNPQHKAELAAVVVENNVVAWILKNAQVKKEPISFENLMGRGQQA